MFASRTNWRLEPNRLAQALANRRRQGLPILDLTVSNPTACGFRYPEDEILAAMADRRAMEYGPESKGRLDARHAIAAYYAGRLGFANSAESVDPERILLVSGTSEGYSHIFRLLCEPGDEILIPTPSYPLFEFLADLADVRLVPYPLFYDDGWQIDSGALRSNVTPRSRAVLVVHPNNPTGSFVGARAAADLTEICAEHEMAIVSDEVFLDYADGKTAHASFAFHRGALTFTLSGLSKISALPQMKLAWIVVSGPESAASAAIERLEVIADTYLSVGTPVQLALPALLELSPGLQAQLRARVVRNLNCLDKAARSSVSGLTRLEREGGWYAVLRVPVSRSDEELAVQLLEHDGVLVHPGSFYNFDSDGYLILSLITPERDFDEGVRRLILSFEN